MLCNVEENKELEAVQFSSLPHHECNVYDNKRNRHNVWVKPIFITFLTIVII